MTFATSRPYDVGRGFTVEFRLHGTRLDALWSPRVPYGRRGRQLLPEYRRARDAFLRSITADVGPILCVETV